jgi:TonB family protein
MKRNLRQILIISVLLGSPACESTQGPIDTNNRGGVAEAKPAKDSSPAAVKDSTSAEANPGISNTRKIEVAKLMNHERKDTAPVKSYSSKNDELVYQRLEKDKEGLIKERSASRSAKMPAAAYPSLRRYDVFEGKAVTRIESNNNYFSHSERRSAYEKEEETTTESSRPSMISKGVLNGSAVSLPKPDYPQAARVVGAAGVVNVNVIIDESGDVISATAVSGHPLLREACIQAAKKAKFKPTSISGQPVKVTGIIVYNFVH